MNDDSIPFNWSPETATLLAIMIDKKNQAEADYLDSLITKALNEHAPDMGIQEK